MPVTVVIGGQYGSEGKGKVALHTVRADPTIKFAVRPGGTNSGHTGFSQLGQRHVLRQLPAAAIDGLAETIIPAGAYVDVDLLLAEIAELGLDPAKVHVDPRAHVLTAEHVRWEQQAELTRTIGSTGSGTGAAVIARAARYAPGLPQGLPVGEHPPLRAFIRDTVTMMRDALDAGRRVVVEGTQGFGLSPIHGDAWPKATSRDTTAAAFLAEAGLSPKDVDEVVLVLRAHPIRVAGDSGPLHGETSWTEVALASGGPWANGEQTSVTRRLRRVGNFKAEPVRRAISVNQPSRIVLNHVDQVDYEVVNQGALTPRALAFVEEVERGIGRQVDLLGIGEKTLIRRQALVPNG